MAVKSKFGGGGEYNPDWMPKVRPFLLLPPLPPHAQPDPPSDHDRILRPLPSLQHEDAGPPPPSPPPAPPSVIDDGVPARPAWRTVHRREDRRAKAKAKARPAPTSPPPAIAAPPLPPTHDLPAWAQWKREFILCVSFLKMGMEGWREGYVKE